jgi:hypothetical protein
MQGVTTQISATQEQVESKYCIDLRVSLSALSQLCSGILILCQSMAVVIYIIYGVYYMLREADQNPRPFVRGIFTQSMCFSNSLW